MPWVNIRNADAFKCNKDTMPEYYKDDIFVGYRHADKIKNALFSHSDTDSATPLSNMAKPMADKKQMDADGTITFSINVKNTGKIAGKETVQLYISDKNHPFRDL